MRSHKCSWCCCREKRRPEMACLVPALAFAIAVCQDDPSWDNNSGKTCGDYASQGWCTGSGFRIGKEWTGGAQFNWPERHCCSCQAAPAISATAATAASSSPTQKRSGSDTAPAASTAGGARVAPVARTRPTEQMDDSIPLELADAIRTRVSTCSSTPADSQQLLYFARLPRTGSALMCQLLGACSSRQARGACGSASSPQSGTATCAKTGDAFSFFGSAKLPSANYAACSGLDGLTAACSSYDGDIGAACQHIGTLQLPGAVMVATERMPDWTLAPCPTIYPRVRMLALLRDPGERAQSAFNFQLENCVCNFRFQWCTMFTSFRFKNRQQKLCAEHSPRHGFAAALAAVRAHGNMVCASPVPSACIHEACLGLGSRDSIDQAVILPVLQPWPLTSSETHHVLGRFTAGVVKEVYTPWFGSYRTSASNTYMKSPLLARRTLANCFAWVGVAEDLALSLQLLKLELPGFFARLDVSKYTWKPNSGSSRPGGDPSAANQSQHPYLRSHMLPGDYEVYDSERKRLFQRAQQHGIVVWGLPPS